MPERPTRPFALAALSADYSDDELDAIAELFDRERLLLRRTRVDGDARVRRAVGDAALRGLVARKALVLEGTAARRRVRFLEPHATLLDPFVGPEATISIRVERRRQTLARALFLRGDCAVEQVALPGVAIKRMTARPRAAATALALDGVELEATPAAGHAHETIELTTRIWDAAEQAIAAGTPPPDRIPAAVVDVLHARTSTTELRIAHRDADGVVTHRRIAWLAAGACGIWSIEPGAGEHAATVLLVRCEADLLRAELGEALSAAITAAEINRP